MSCAERVKNNVCLMHQAPPISGKAVRMTHTLYNLECTVFLHWNDHKYFLERFITSFKYFSLKLINFYQETGSYLRICTRTFCWVFIPLFLSLLTHCQMSYFRLFQTERVCRQQFQIWQKWQKVIQTGRKHCGKRRNCSLQAISPFPTVFSKGLFSRGVKRYHCVGMG